MDATSVTSLPTFPNVTLFWFEEAEIDQGCCPTYDYFIANTYSVKMLYFVILKITLCKVGLVGNILNVRTFLRIGLRDNVTIVFFHLAVSDLSFVITSLVKVGASLTEYLPYDVFASFRLHPNSLKEVVDNTFEEIFIIASVYLTTFLAVQRCLCVVRPLQFKGIFTRRRTLVVIAVIWVVSLFNCFKNYIYIRIMKMEWPNNATWFVVGYKAPIWNLFILTSEKVNSSIIFVFQVSIVTSIFLMARALKISANFRQKASIPGSQEGQTADVRGSSSEFVGDRVNDKDKNAKTVISHKERQVILQVSIVSVIMFFTNAHILVFQVLVGAYPDIDKLPGFWHGYAIYREVTHVLFLINTAVNFFIYFKFNSKFRQMCFRRQPTGKGSALPSATNRQE